MKQNTNKLGMLFLNTKEGIVLSDLYSKKHQKIKNKYNLIIKKIKDKQMTEISKNLIEYYANFDNLIKQRESKSE